MTVCRRAGLHVSTWTRSARLAANRRLYGWQFAALARDATPASLAAS
jgi:hypothetical protein